MKAAAPLDYRDLARRRLPPFLFESIEGASPDEVTLAENRAALREVTLRQRALTGAVDLQHINHDVLADAAGRAERKP